MTISHCAAGSCFEADAEGGPGWTRFKFSHWNQLTLKPGDIIPYEVDVHKFLLKLIHQAWVCRLYLPVTPTTLLLNSQAEPFKISPSLSHINFHEVDFDTEFLRHSGITLSVFIISCWIFSCLQTARGSKILFSVLVKMIEKHLVPARWPLCRCSTVEEIFCSSHGRLGADYCIAIHFWKILAWKIW